MSNTNRSLLALTVLLPLLGSAGPSFAGFSQSYQATGSLHLEVQATGSLHLEVVGAAGLNPPASGSLNLATAPSGTIKKAFLYATQTGNTAGMSGSFAGLPLATVGPFATDSQLVTVASYRWDVTMNVMPGMSSYSFMLLDGLGNPVAVAGVGLVVVWEDVSTQPLRQVTIVDGVQQVGESGLETEFMAMSSVSAGSATAWVFVTDDDAPTTNEVVSFNSNAVGGPLVANLGLNASVEKMTGLTALSNVNSLSIKTISDHLTWVMGALAVDLAPIKTEKTSFGDLKSKYDSD